MRQKLTGSHVIAIALFLLACTLGVLSQQRAHQPVEIPRAQFADSTPLGGKGLGLVLERLGYRTSEATQVLKAMPADARVWVLLDPQAGFSRSEADALLRWVRTGGTLIWASPQWHENTRGLHEYPREANSGIARLQSELKISNATTPLFEQHNEPLPPLQPLKQGSVSPYWSGVEQATGSSGGMTISRPHLELAGSPVDLQLARIDYGTGRVFVAPDALLFTNYSLAKPDNAVLVTNLVRLHATAGAAVYFDERQHGETEEEKIEPSWLYYLWQPPLRYAVLQLLAAVLLAAILYGRRLGAPVPLPDGGPVTRASQFAAAMGALFQKVNRPRAAGIVIGDNFRRQLTRRLGLSIADDDELIARRAAEATGYPARMIDRLLLQAKAPDDDEARTLSDAQEMEKILRSLDQR